MKKRNNIKYKKGSEKKIGEVMDKIFAGDDRLSKKYRQFDIDQIWRTCMGKSISKYTREVKLRNKSLVLYIDSAPLKEELLYRKKQIIEKLNAEIDYFKIESLIIK